MKNKGYGFAPLVISLWTILFLHLGVATTVHGQVSQNSPKVIYVGIQGAGNLLEDCAFLPIPPVDYDPYLYYSALYTDGDNLNRLGLLAQEQLGSLPAIGFYIGSILPTSVTRIFTPPATSEVVKFIQDNYEIGDVVFLLGFSVGAGDAQDVSVRLASLGIPVRLLGLMDSIEYCGFVDARIPENVNRAMGFYQTQTSVVLLRGESNFFADNPSMTEVSNTPVVNPLGPDPNASSTFFDVTYMTWYHRNMDNDKKVWSPMLNYMLDQLSLPLEPSITLTFPLAGGNPYTAPISSVVDHSFIEGGRFIVGPGDNVVISYTGELGKSRCGPSGEPCGFYNPNSPDFIVNGNYVGANVDGSDKLKVLNYEGHPGYDYPCNEGLDDILAAADGELSIPTFDPVNLPGSADPHTKFNTLRITHPGGWETWYLHAKLGTERPPGQVFAGQPIAKCGSTGVLSSHLHFEVRQNGKIVDPYGWEWNTGDPISQNTLQASVQAEPLWGISRPVVTAVSLLPSGGGFSATIAGYNFAPDALVTLWDRYGQFFSQAITPSLPVTDTQIVAQLPITDPGKYVLKVKNPLGPRSKGLALSSVSSSSSVPLALIGQPAPGGGTFSSFATFYDMNNQGDTFFNADVDLNGDGFGDEAGTFNFSGGTITKVTAGGFTQLGATKINNIGDIAFGDASVPGRTQAIYFLKAGSATPVKIAELDQPSPISGANYSDLRGPVALNDRGDVVFWSFILDVATNTGSCCYLFLYSNDDGSVKKVVGTGDGPTPIGGTFGNIGRAQLTSDGDVVFDAQANGGSSQAAIFLFSPSTGLSKIVAIGDPAPSDVGGTFGPQMDFAHTKSLSGREFVFMAQITGGLADQAIFLKEDVGVESASNVRMVVYAGQATNTEAGGTFSTGVPSGDFPFEIYDGDPQIRSDGGVLFLSLLNGAQDSDGTPTGKGIFLWTGKEFTKVVVEGDRLTSGGKLSGVSSHILNDLGQVSYFVAGIN